ncbi:MAG: carboxylating nicotinate-nucleotide diphosphorylase [Gemmatimonadota bacterium]
MNRAQRRVRYGAPLSLEALIDAALAEDVGDGDRTTEWSVPEDLAGGARIVAKQAGIVCGLAPAEAIFLRVDPELSVRGGVADGARVAPGAEIMVVAGALRSILTAERTALNFLGRLSGIATLAADYCAAVEGTDCRILDTRKTTPGWRALEKEATRCGGAVNHRRGLFDMVLVKENHIRAAGGLGAALQAVGERARREGIEVEVEACSLAELREALAGGPDRILLDNMSIGELEEAVRLVRGHEGDVPLLEASGNVTLQTVGRIAATGVDFVSVGALTHSAPVMDFSLQVIA